MEHDKRTILALQFAAHLKRSRNASAAFQTKPSDACCVHKRLHRSYARLRARRQFHRARHACGKMLIFAMAVPAGSKKPKASRAPSRLKRRTQKTLSGEARFRS